jgi:hypothetical protein
MEITFESQYSRLLKDTYFNLYKSNSSPSEFLEMIFKKYNIPVVLYDSKPSKKIENILTTADINLYEWIIKFCEKYEITLFSDRYSIYAIHKDAYSYDKINFNEESEYSNRDEVDSFRRINEYRIKELDYKFISSNNTGKEYYFDISNSIIKPVNKTLKSYYDQYKISENGYVGNIPFSDPFLISGYRLRDENNLKNNLNNNQTLEIVIRGLNNDKILNKIIIEINNPENIEDVNYIVSGTYVIKKVIDKINMNKFYHYIELDRVDYANNKYIE